MDRDVAEHLLSEFEKQFTMARVDENKFLNALLNTPVPESSRFYEEIPLNEQQIEESLQYHYLSLKRVLRNRNAEGYRITPLKQLWEKFTKSRGIYSSDVLSRDLRANKILAEMMYENKNPFSLLGKFESNDTSGEDMRVITRPVLIIPDVEKDGTEWKIIKEWEEANKIYEEERGFLFKSRRRINPQEYSFK